MSGILGHAQAQQARRAAVAMAESAVVDKFTPVSAGGTAAVGDNWLAGAPAVRSGCEVGEEIRKKEDREVRESTPSSLPLLPTADKTTASSLRIISSSGGGLFQLLD